MLGYEVRNRVEEERNYENLAVNIYPALFLFDLYPEHQIPGLLPSKQQKMRPEEFAPSAKPCSISELREADRKRARISTQEQRRAPTPALPMNGSRLIADIQQLQPRPRVRDAGLPITKPGDLAPALVVVSGGLDATAGALGSVPKYQTFKRSIDPANSPEYGRHVHSKLASRFNLSFVFLLAQYHLWSPGFPLSLALASCLRAFTPSLVVILSLPRSFSYLSLAIRSWRLSRQARRRRPLPDLGFARFCFLSHSLLISGRFFLPSPSPQNESPPYEIKSVHYLYSSWGPPNSQLCLPSLATLVLTLDIGQQ
ncbi:hypothetical protein EDB92DRAFT_2016782 [Lactarius akahatsu]|uniref:Uncharacterized protein n=1 Tax=Lactarius akahatsu TaxID=416441 RepID=A0AAD4QB99_9AGAM|nr:hypothetical protein EDB92DRAFT_2016782 [Lactarius akahatsu]